MKPTNSATHTTDILSLQDFCKATEKVYDIEIPNIDILVSNPDGWTKLADLWEEYSEDYGTYPFHKAVSYIRYAYDFDFYSSLDKAFLMAVCRELCSDGAAGRAWRKHVFFKTALAEAEPEKNSWGSSMNPEENLRVSCQHCYYLEQRMMYRYWYAEGICESERDTASRYIVAYEEFVTTLCPETANWTPDYWVDVAHIYDALQYQYRGNYRFTPRDYEILISIFRMETSSYSITSDKEHDYLRCVINLEHFSMPWAQALWPTNTEKNIIKMYYLAKGFVDNDCAFEDILCPCYVYDVDNHVFTHSWIYSVVQKWIDSGELHTRYENDYKKAMFEISLNI